MITKENILEICSGYSEAKFRTLMPNTKLTESGSMKMGVCLGFLQGLKLSGNHEMFDTFADNFIKVFNHPYICPNGFTLSDRVYPNREEYMSTPSSVCVLSDDGTPLSFSFCIYNYTKDIHGDNIIEHGLWKDRYKFSFNGGIIFHGLGQQFSVTLDNQPGWQIHT